MTQPDGYTPSGAANYDSFAGFAATTQEQWNTQITAGMTGHFSIMSGICAMLEQIPFLGDLIERGGGPTGSVWGPVGALIDGLVNFVEEFCSLFTGHAVTGTTPTTLLGGVSSVFNAFLDNPIVTFFASLVENTGFLIMDVINGLLSFLESLFGLVTGDFNPMSILSDIRGIIDAVVTFFTGGQSSGNFLTDVVSTLGSWGNSIWDGIQNALSLVGQVIDNIVNAILGIFGLGHSADSSLTALQQQTDIVKNNASAIAALQALLSSGVTVADNFERTGTDLGANWSVAFSGGGAGSLGTGGHFAYWQQSGGSSRTELCLWNGTPAVTNTDNQRISMVLASQGLDSTFGSAARTYLIGRANAGGSRLVMAEWRAWKSDANEIALSVWIDGAQTVLAHTSGVPIPGAGATLALLCGVQGSVRRFQVLINNTVILDGSDAASYYGAGYRGIGMGAAAGVNADQFWNVHQNAPSQVDYWIAQDQ